jgi:hypothetical protein
MSNKTNTPAVETKSTKRGRPTVAGSKRQAVLAMRQTKRDSGIEIKRGRPAGTNKLKIDPSIEVVLKVKAPKAKKVTDTVAVVDFNPELTHESLQVL